MTMRMDDSTIMKRTSVLLTRAKIEQMSYKKAHTGKKKNNCQKVKIIVKIIFEIIDENNWEIISICIYKNNFSKFLSLFTSMLMSYMTLIR